MAIGETKVIKLKMELLKEEFFRQLNDSKNQLAGIVTQINKIETKSKGVFKNWQKDIIVLNQGFELFINKLSRIFNILSKPLAEAGLFEQFRTTLTNLVGSTEIATQRFRELIDFAAKTPFNVPGIIEAGNRLEALGRYSLDLIRDLGDLAAASGKPVMQAIEAYTNLVTGRTGIAVKQFRAMLISTSDWTRKIGKEVLKTGKGAKASVEEMINALPEIIREKNFSGLMDKQSQTLLGKISNLQDMLQQALASIGDEFLASTKDIVTTITNWLEIIRDDAPRYIEMLKEIWSWVSAIGKAFLGWKAITTLVGSVGTAIASATLPVRLLETAIIKNANALKVYGVRAKLMDKYNLDLKKSSQQLGRQWGSMGNTASKLSLAITKLTLAIRANPIGAMALAIGSLVIGYRAWQRAVETNYKAEANAADSRRRELQTTYDMRKAKLDEAKATFELTKSAGDLIKVNGKLNPEIDEQEAMLTKLRTKYPELINDQNEFTGTTEDMAKAMRKSATDILDLEKGLDKLKQQIIDTNSKMLMLKAQATAQSFVGEGTDLWMEKSKNNMTETIPILGGIFGFVLEQLDNLTGVTRSAMVGVVNAWSENLINSKNQDELAENFQAIRESILGDKQYDDVFKAKAVAWLERVMKGISNKLKFDLDQSFIPLDKQLTASLDSQSAGKTAKQFLEYLKTVKEKLITDGNYKNVDIGGTVYSSVVADGGRIDENATKEKGAAILRIVENAIIKQEGLVKGLEDTANENKKKRDKAREDAFKAFQEKLSLLEVNFQLSSEKDWQKYYDDIGVLQKDFEDNFLKIYTDSNSKELGHKKKLIDASKDLDKDYYKEQEDAIEKQTALFNAKFDESTARKKSAEFINNVFKDISKEGVDLTSEHAVEFFNKLKEMMKKLADDINNDETLQIKLKFGQNVQGGGSLADSVPVLLGLTPEGIADVREMLDNLADKKLQVKEQKILERTDLDDLEREKLIYEAQTETLNDQVGALEKIKSELQTQLDFANLSAEMQVYAKDFITDLELQIASLKSKLAQAGIELEESITSSNERAWKKAIQGIKAFTSHLQSAANAWYDIVKDSVDKQVQAWLDAQNESIDNEEKRGMKFARTKQQEDRVRAEADKKREEAEAEADKKAKERMKYWFDLKKAASISQILVDTATAIMNAWSGNAYNPILATAITALIGITSAAQIAAVNSQELPGFKTGGWTGDEDRNRVVGNVHGQEYVVKSGPAKKYRPILDMLNSSVEGVDVNRDFRMSGYLNDFNSKATEHLMRLNKTLEHYLANPVPARAYLDNREAEKMTRQGIKKIRRSSL